VNHLPEFCTDIGDIFPWKNAVSNPTFFTLFHGKNGFGSLQFKDQISTFATAENLIQPWTFKTVGYLNPYIAIQFPEADSDYATFHQKKANHGTLQLLDGRRFLWDRDKSSRDLLFVDNNKDILLRFSPKIEKPANKNPFYLEAESLVEGNHMTNQEFSILINLGFYLLVLTNLDRNIRAGIV